jgi:hypothetical protein
VSARFVRRPARAQRRWRQQLRPHAGPRARERDQVVKVVDGAIRTPICRSTGT